MSLFHEAVTALLHASYLEGAVCLLLGASFPFIAAAWLRRGRPGTRTGQLFMANTLGGVMGSLSVGFFLLPLWGEQKSYLALALLLAVAAGSCLWLVPRSRDTRAPRLLNLLALSATAGICIGLPPKQLTRAHFQSGGELVAIEEGATTTAAAVRHYVYGEPHYMELQTPGISMSSTRLGARRYMTLMAHAAMLHARDPRSALLICYGVGNTARALLSHHELDRLDVVDISPEVLSLAPHFAAHAGADPLRDPRTHVFVDDGRHHLITHDARYDVITAEPPPPNYAGVVNLYSREFYQLAKRRLSPGGVVTQWLPVFQLGDDDVRAIVAAFVAELPYTALLYGYSQQLILIGSREPLTLDEAELAAAETPERLAALRRDGIGSVEQLLAAVVQTDAELRASVVAVPPLRDAQPTIEYPRAALAIDELYTAHIRPNRARAVSMLRGRPTGARRQRLLATNATLERVLAALVDLERPRDEARELRLARLLQPALAQQPEDEGLWSLLAVDAERVHLAEQALAKPGAQALLSRQGAPLSGRARQRRLVLHDAQWLLARRAFYARDYARAYERLGEIAPEPNELASYALFTAGCLRALGQPAQSATAFRAAAAASSDTSFQAECLALAASTVERFAFETGPFSRD